MRRQGRQAFSVGPDDAVASGPYPPPPGDPLPPYPAPTAARGGQIVWTDRPFSDALYPPFPKTGWQDGIYVGDFCGVHIDDAPPIYGGNTEKPQCVMSMLDMNYPPDFQPKIWATHVARGHSDFHQSLWHFRYFHPSSGIASVKAGRPHAGSLLWAVKPVTWASGTAPRSVAAVRALLASPTLPDHVKQATLLRSIGSVAGVDGGDRTADQFVAHLKAIQAAGLRTHVFLTANDVRDGGVAYYKAELEAWIDAMIAARAIDRAGVGWQLDRSNSPRSLQEIIEWFSSKFKPHGIPLDAHWINDAAAWWDDGDMPFEQRIASMGGADHQGITTRFAWHDLNRQFLTGGAMVQFDTAAPIKDEQEAITALLRTCDVTVFEHSAQERFDGTMPEAYARMKGRALLGAAPDAHRQVGAGNGLGELDGRAA